MDRLLCGDVGFGKTELAMRAAFVSSINGFGVLVLAPTTVLSKQLYGSFLKRFSGFNISVGFVSRFVKKSERDSVFLRFRNKKINILVGTHSIMSSFKSLCAASLVIVDDEHKFGAKQKESIKQTNPKANLLYMSATPIPRTLKLALSNFKKMSLSEFCKHYQWHNYYATWLFSVPLDRFDYVGITENFDESFEKVKDVFEIKTDSVVKKINVTPKKYDKMNSELRKELENLKSLDYFIYNYFKKKFHE